MSLWILRLLDCILVAFERDVLAVTSMFVLKKLSHHDFSATFMIVDLQKTPSSMQRIVVKQR